jgi:hypothetical protein
MKVEQISVFLENKSGRLSEVTRILGDGGINLRALTLADTTDFGILRLIVNDNARAVRFWKEKLRSARPRSSRSRSRIARAGWRTSSTCWAPAGSTSSTCTPSSSRAPAARS